MSRDVARMRGADGALVFAYGPEEGRRLIAVHGFRGTHFGLEPLAVALGRRGFRVLVPDLPGCGQSPPLPGRHDAAGYGAWLRELAAQSGAELLLGHSFGSVIVGAALSGSDASQAAVLVNPIVAPPLEGPQRVATAAARLFYAAAAGLPSRLGRTLLGSRTIAAAAGTLMTTTSDSALRRWIRTQHRAQAAAFASPDVVLQSYRASVSTTVGDYRWDTPVLVIDGGRDPLSPPLRAGALRASVAHRHFPDHGHLLPYEAPTQVAEAIATWSPDPSGPSTGHTGLAPGAARLNA
ncbi:MAG: alpha/beta fold hydrolase [Microbacterium sp.]